ncbi:MAG: tRNA-dihydrouridine synthase [Candidatus Daviesbacteria bacterium]|nr:tRNA-dihydrouridine synthase [Candidatus Daviesbacteria bacterium]
MKNFWDKLRRPFFALAPMEDITDFVFRQIVAKYGKPDVLFTEFVSVDGLCSEGRKKLLPRLKFAKCEKPIVAQIWGSDPDKFFESAKLISKMGFDGIDINMGCPDKKVVKKGAGGGLIKTPELAAQIITATRNGAGKLPISVKTRIGFDKIITEKWISFLLSFKLPALTIHCRTVKEMSKVPAHWDEIKLAVKLKEKLAPETLIIGNGDVASYKQGVDLAKESGCDGIMIGRGIFNNLWIFNPKIEPVSITPEMKIHALIDHIKLFEKTWSACNALRSNAGRGKNKNYDILKKFYKAYISGFPEAKQLRVKLMGTKSASQALALLSNPNLSISPYT